MTIPTYTPQHRNGETEYRCQEIDELPILLLDHEDTAYPVGIAIHGNTTWLTRDQAELFSTTLAAILARLEKEETP